jgi:glycosyltransferase involved in cell wall biosynthesis
LRIGFDAWGLSGTLLYTGMGQFARCLIQGIADADGDIQIVAYGAPDEPRPTWLPSAAAWRAPRVPAPPKLRGLISRTLTLRRQVALDGVDLFHAPALHLRPSLPPVPTLRCPLVATVHDVIPLTEYSARLPRRLRWYYRWNLRRALRGDAITTVSESARAQITALTGVENHRIHVVPNGVDFAANPDPAPLERLGIRQPYLLYAGSYEPRKNLSRALVAYARLSSEGIEHHLVAIVEAASGHAAAVHALADELGVTSRVHFVHSLADADLRALYTHADAVFFPSIAEGFGFPPLQAAACAVPVVASDIASVRETMGDVPRYADPLDVDSMVGALRSVLTDDAVRSGMRSGGSIRAAEYTWPRAVAKYLTVYRSVVGKRANGRASGE